MPSRHQPTSCLAAVATHVVVSSGQSTNQTTWAASDVIVVTDTELKLMFQCCLDGTAASCRRQAVGDRRPLCRCLFTAFQAASKTILERFCIVSNCRHVGLCAWTALVDSLHRGLSRLSDQGGMVAVLGGGWQTKPILRMCHCSSGRSRNLAWRRLTSPPFSQPCPSLSSPTIPLLSSPSP